METAIETKPYMPRSLKREFIYEANVMHMHAAYRPHLPYDFREDFLRKFTFYVAMKQIKFSDLNKIHINLVPQSKDTQS